MTIPNKVKVGGVTYDVRVVPEINRGEAAGETDTKDLTIKIAQAKRESMEWTFWHEVFHAINFEKREEEIEYLSMAMYQVIKDNPSIFTGGERKSNGKK